MKTPNHRSTIKAHITNAVHALRAAARKLGLVAEAFDRRHAEYLDFQWILEARYGAQTFATLLNTGCKPTMPTRIFRELVGYANNGTQEIPHAHGAVLALKLAERCLTQALEAADQLDYDRIDPEFQTAFAARGMVRSSLAAFGSALYVFDDEEMLDAILAGNDALAA